MIRWAGPDHVGLVGHGRDFGSFSKENGELPSGFKQWSAMIVFAFKTITLAGVWIMDWR